MEWIHYIGIRNTNIYELYLHRKIINDEFRIMSII
jgi:hypothetical protein